MAEQTIELVPFTDEWAVLFRQEKDALAAVLGDNVLAIEHIGSTAIAGIVAKPILDIGIAVTSFEQGRQCVARIESLGYMYRGEYGIPRRHYFVKGMPRTHHLHMLEVDSKEWQNHLLFRDYLNQHPDIAAQYSALKQTLAVSCAGDRFLYTESKAPFIQNVLRDASRERNPAIIA